MIQKSTMNAISNAHNHYQTQARKVLTVCSAGMLRSPTLANYLHKKYGYNTRACGTYDYALVPMSEVLLEWADVVIFVNEDNYKMTTYDPLWNNNIYSVVLNIPDLYQWDAPELHAQFDKIEFDKVISDLYTSQETVVKI